MSNHALRASGFLGPEFNAFLFESIGLDQYGRPLSVISALARLDMDAWAEAAQLARLPRDIAADKLSMFIRKFTECPQAVKDSHKIAVRLVELLPSRATLAGQNTATPLAPSQAEKLGRSTVVFILLMALLIGTQMLASHPRRPALPPSAPPAATATVPAPNNVQQ